MIFLCQQKSYVKNFTNEVTSCTKNGSHYHVICEDTIFFPTGGGQSCDKGIFGGVPVLDVYKEGDDAVHVVDKEFKEGEKVNMTIDWPHRFDQMQQHTGQHLLSAVITKMFNYSTEAWGCGTDLSNVDLDTKNKEITDKDMAAIEEECNKKIIEGIKVHAEWYRPEDPEVLQAHSRGLPKDHDGGLVRIVTIDGIDHNMCCGIHVENLSHLQALKLLRVSRAPKGRYLLHFVVGNRVLKKLKETYNRERELSAVIKSNPENLVELVQKNIDLSRKQNKYLSNVLKDMAILEARNFKRDDPYQFVYRREGDMAYAKTYYREFLAQQLHHEAFLIIITGETPDGGLLVYNKTGDAQAISHILCDPTILNGTGKGIRDNLFTGRVIHPERYAKANATIMKHYKFETGLPQY